MEYINQLFGNFNTLDKNKNGNKNKARKNNNKKDNQDSENDSDFEAISDLSSTKNPFANRNKTEKKINNDNNNKNNKKKTSNKIGIYNIGEDEKSEEDSIGSKNLFEHPEEGLPDFLRECNIRDKSGKKMDDPDYDSTTLLVPQAYLKNCTPAMQQYWHFKSQNFDKVIFFKLGKFYELFYDDAIVGNKVIDLNWMGNDPKKLHVGFPEKSLQEKGNILIENGFKVAVIEQVETVEELEERLKKTKSSNKMDKCVKRDLCNVFTKGTFIHESHKFDNKNNYKNKFCITLISKKIYKNELEKINKKDDNQMDKNFNKDEMNNSIVDNPLIGYQWNFIIFDVTTINFFFGEISHDDENFTKIKTLLYNINPQEIIIPKNNLDEYIINFISSLASRPLISKLKNDYSLLSLLKLTIKYFGEERSSWNKTLLSHIKEEKEQMLNVLYFTILYMENLLLAEQLLNIANWENYESNMIVSKNLILDYQTISNLEIIETKLDAKNPEAGSLLEYMNQAVSPFGMRKMKQWTLNPLSNKTDIDKRLDMVTDLINNFECVTSFRLQAGKFNDLERLVAKIYKFSIQSNSKAVYFEDFSKTRIQEFFKIINLLRKSMDIFHMFKDYLANFQSIELKKKISLRSEEFIEFDKETNKEYKLNGEVDNIIEVLEELEDYYKESKDDNGDTIIIPKEGVQDSYDEYFYKIKVIKEKFEKILKEEKQKFKCPLIAFTHTKNYKYELEIPEECVKSRNLDSTYKLTTSRKGFMRYHTQEILDLIEEYEMYQDLLKKENNKFNVHLFQKFHSKNFEITKYIENLSDLDCLCALAYISNQVRNYNLKFSCLSKYSFKNNLFIYFEYYKPFIFLFFNIISF